MLDLDGLREACTKVSYAFKIYPHLSETVYQRALQIELTKQGHSVVAEVVKPVKYHGMHVGTVRADLVVHDRNGDDFVIELKRAPKILQGHIDQLRTYLALTATEGEMVASPVVGAVVNFGVSPAEIYFEDMWAREVRPLRASSRSRSRSRSRSPASLSDRALHGSPGLGEIQWHEMHNGH